MTAIARSVIAVTGLAFIACGVAILFSGGFTLPSKTPPLRFQFFGLSLFLLGSAPLTVGGLSLAIAGRSLDPQSGAARLVFGLGMAAVALAFLVAPKL